MAFLNLALGRDQVTLSIRKVERNGDFQVKQIVSKARKRFLKRIEIRNNEERKLYGMHQSKFSLR